MNLVNQESLDMLHATVTLQQQILAAGLLQHPFERAVTELMRVTESRYGWLAEFDSQADGHSTLRLRISATAAGRDSPEIHCQSLSGQLPTAEWSAPLARTIRELTVSLDSSAADNCGLPPHHPPLSALVWIPLCWNGELLGVAALADRPGGYDECLIDRLSPLIDACGAILHGVRQQQRQQATEAALRQQIALLECQSDLLRDGKLVVDHERCWLQCNRLFRSMWQIPDDYADLRSPPEFIRWLSRLVEDPESFIRSTEDIYAHSERSSLEEIRMKDGRIIERYSAPFRMADDSRVGRAWYFRDITERKRAEQDLRNLAESASPATGKGFFRSLVRDLTHSLEVDFAFVGRLACDSPPSIRTIAGFGDGQWLESLQYELDGTPCQVVMNRQPCCHLSGVQQKYPHDQFLVDEGIESYIGIPLTNASDQVVGLITALSRRPLQRPESALNQMKVWAARSAAELNRLSAIEELEIGRQRFRALVEHGSDAINILDRQGRITYSSPNNHHLLGYQPDEVLGRSGFEWVRADAGPQARELWRTILQTPQEPIRTTIPIRHRDGTSRWIELCARNLLADPAVQGIVTNWHDVTERTHVEESLRASQSVLEQAQAVGQVGSWISDPGSHGQLVWSAETCRIFGISPEQFDGRVESFFALVHPDDLRAVQESSRQALAGQCDYALEHRIVRPDGKVRWVHQRAEVQFDADQRPLRMLGVVRDVTKEKLAQDSLRESEARFRRLFENSPDAIFVEDLEGNVLDVNPAGCRLHDRPRSELVGKNVLDLVPPSMREAAKRDFGRMVRGEIEHVDGFSWTRSGGSLPVSIRASRIEYSGKEAILLHVRDVSAQRAAEVALRESEAHLRALLEQMPAILWTVDQDLRITLSQGRALRATGRQPNETVGLTLEEYLAGRADADQILAHHRRALDGQSVSYEATVNGSTFECRVQPLRSAQGEVIGCLGAAIDVTEQRRATSALRDSEERLRLVLEQLPAVVWTVDSRQRISLMLGKPLAVMGRTTENTVGLTLGEYFQGRRDGAPLLDHHVRALSGESIQYETQVCGLALECRVQPLRDSRGEIVGCLGAALDITDRVRATEAVRESESRFRAIFDSNPECVKLLNRDGRLLEINRAGLDMIGADDASQIVGQCIDGIVVRLYRDRFRQLITNVFNGRADVLEFEIVGLRGTRRWLETHATPLFDGVGKIAAALSVTRDITDRKRAEQELHQRNRELEAIFAAYPDLYFVLDPQGKVEQYRAGQTSDLYVSPDQFLGNQIHDFLPPDVAARFDAAASKLAAGSPLETVEYELPMPGGPRQFEARVALLPDQRTSVLVRNITDRKRLERAIRDSEERFRQFAEHLPFMVCMLTPNMGQLLYANRAAELVSGRPRNSPEMLPSNWLNLIHEDDRSRIAQRMREPFDGGPRTTEFRIWRADGSLRWLRTLAVPLVNQQGEFYLLTVLVEDVTEQKQAAEHLALKQAELLHVSRLSTMGHMVATMSHEISQPLAALGNYSAACASLLKESPAPQPEQFRHYVLEIARQTQRAGAILRRLRAFGARSVAERLPADLHWLLRESAELVASELRRQGVALLWDLGEPSPQVLVDAIQFQQVIVNLLTNACDALQCVDPPHRSAVIRTFTNGTVAVLEIIDSGPGLPPDVLPSLFEPFFTTKPDGMGLGLSICREIIEDHGGQIEAVNALQGGAIFRVQLPLDVTASPPVVVRVPELQT